MAVRQPSVHGRPVSALVVYGAYGDSQASDSHKSAVPPFLVMVAAGRSWRSASSPRWRCVRSKRAPPEDGIAAKL
jgi:hypothetical protein